MENDREMNHKSVCRFALYDDAYVLVGHTSAPQDLGQDHEDRRNPSSCLQKRALRDHTHMRLPNAILKRAFPFLQICILFHHFPKSEGLRERYTPYCHQFNYFIH